MTTIKDIQQYEKALERIEELLLVVNNEIPATDKNFVELDLLSGLVADFEAIHFPVRKPTLVEALKHSMSEMGLTQKAVAEILEVSASRISEYLTGKTEPTLKVARSMHKRLNIDPSIILG